MFSLISRYQGIIGIKINPAQKTCRTTQSDCSHEPGNFINRRTYLLIIWPQKDPDLLDFGIIRSTTKDYCRAETCLEMSLDHSSIIFTINSKIMIKSKPCTLCNTETKRFYFQALLTSILDNSIPLKIDDDIICAVENFNLYCTTGRLKCNDYG